MGCRFSDDCFTCPFPDDCIEGSGINKVSLAKKMRAIDLHNSGMPPEQIAKTLGMSPRQIERYLKDPVKQRQDYILIKYMEG